MMETMIPRQVGMRLRTKNKKRKKNKKAKREKKGRGPKKEKRGKMREKERRDNVAILLPHSCFKVAP